jgi:glycosyltransferase involved in cell wall biosynthesis
MNMLVNASALRVAGGLSVGLNFLRSLAEIDCREHSTHFLAPNGFGYERWQKQGLTVELVPSIANNPLYRLYFDNYWLPHAAKRAGATILFSMANIAAPIAMRQLLLFHWSYAVYPETPLWAQMHPRERLSRRLRLTLFRRRLKYATAVAAQTETTRRRLITQYGLEPTCVHVVPNAVSLPEADTSSQQWVGRRENLQGKTTLLCLSRYYSHKNLEVFHELGALIKRDKAPFMIVTTIGHDQGPQAVKFLEGIEKRRLSEVIVNIGPVPMKDVPSLYRSVDGLILPTLLESFSGTYVEAMHFGIPIFTSDLDFAHDVCRDAAFYFDPLDPLQILSTLGKAYTDKQALEHAVERGFELVRSMPSWHDVARQYLSILEQMNGS